MVEEGSVHGAKKALLRRTVSWLCCWALVFAHAIQGQQLLEVGAGKLWASIDRDRCWQASIPLDAQPKNRQTGTIRRWVEGQVECGNASGMGENEQRQPTFSQRLTGPGIAKNQVQFGMIEMCHGPTVAPMSAHGFFLFTNVILERVGSPGPLTCDGLLICRFVQLDFPVECSWREGFQIVFFRLQEILAVSTTLWFACYRVVV